MLYDLSSPSTEYLFKSWNTCIKLIWGVPKSTFTYLVDNVLSLNYVSLKHQVYARYVSYFQGLFNSSSREVRHLARIVSRDVRSVTCRNVRLIEESTGLSPWDYSVSRIKEKLQCETIPAKEFWRPGLLIKLLERKRREVCGPEMDEMIESLCTT